MLNPESSNIFSEFLLLFRPSYHSVLTLVSHKTQSIEIMEELNNLLQQTTLVSPTKAKFTPDQSSSGPIIHSNDIRELTTPLPPRLKSSQSVSLLPKSILQKHSRPQSGVIALLKDDAQVLTNPQRLQSEKSVSLLPDRVLQRRSQPTPRLIAPSFDGSQYINPLLHPRLQSEKSVSLLPNLVLQRHSQPTPPLISPSFDGSQFINPLLPPRLQSEKSISLLPNRFLQRNSQTGNATPINRDSGALADVIPSSRQVFLKSSLKQNRDSIEELGKKASHTRDHSSTPLPQNSTTHKRKRHSGRRVHFKSETPSLPAESTESSSPSWDSVGKLTHIDSKWTFILSLQIICTSIQHVWCKQ